MKQFASPYCAMGNNTILFIDPNGKWAGKYVDSETGEELGEDGVNDGLIHRIPRADYDRIAKETYLSAPEAKKKAFAPSVVETDTRQSSMPSDPKNIEADYSSDPNTLNLLEREDYLKSEAMRIAGYDKISNLGELIGFNGKVVTVDGSSFIVGYDCYGQPTSAIRAPYAGEAPTP